MLYICTSKVEIPLHKGYLHFIFHKVTYFRPKTISIIVATIIIIVATMKLIIFDRIDYSLTIPSGFMLRTASNRSTYTFPPYAFPLLIMYIPAAASPTARMYL